MLETLIDMYMAGGYEPVRGYSLAGYICNAEMPLLRLHDHLDRAWLGDEDTERFAEGLLSSFRLFALLQSLYRNRLIGRLAPVLFPMAPGAVREVLALVYSPRLLIYRGRIEGEIPYRHPSTGEARADRIEVLFQDAVDRSVEFCLGLEPLLRPGSTAPSPWSLPPVDPPLSLAPECPLRYFSRGRFFD